MGRGAKTEVGDWSIGSNSCEDAREKERYESRQGWAEGEQPLAAKHKCYEQCGDD